MHTLLPVCSWGAASPRLTGALPRAAIAVGCTIVLHCQRAEAHVKWFCAYDTSIPPLPLQQVFTTPFILTEVSFSVLMFVAYAVDGALDGTAPMKRVDDALLRGKQYIDLIVRATVGAFFVSLWTASGMILTPELRTSSATVPWVQLAIAGSMLFQTTLPVGAAGIIGLYVYGITKYGAFHMMDYPIFPGLAAYLGFAATPKGNTRDLSIPVIYCGVAITMMWGAVEKFGYPFWTLPLTATHRELMFGLRFDWFMAIAGFVEFSLAFFMLTGTALLRLACLALLILLTTAVPEFGKIDAIGHSLIIAGLIVMIIAGQHSIEIPPLLRPPSVLVRAGAMTLCYTLGLAGFFGLYYGAQYLAGR